MSASTSTVRDSRKHNSLAPLKDVEKCIPSHKRRRSEEDDSRVFEMSSTQDAPSYDAFVDSWEYDEMVNEDEELTRDVATLKAAVGQMQVQVTAAAAQLKELRGLVALLARHRSQVPAHPPKRNRADM